MRFSYSIFEFQYKFADWRIQSADESIGEPTSFNQQKNKTVVFRNEDERDLFRFRKQKSFKKLQGRAALVL